MIVSALDVRSRVVGVVDSSAGGVLVLVSRLSELHLPQVDSHCLLRVLQIG